MPNEIKAKYSAAASLTISLGSLASSTTGVGRQSTMVDNSTTKYQRIHLYAKIRVGTSPTANRSIRLYLIKGDASSFRTDNAGASDAALTLDNARFIGALFVDVTTSGLDYCGDFEIENPGPSWGTLVSHDTVAALDPTGGNHVITWIGENPEVQ